MEQLQAEQTEQQQAEQTKIPVLPYSLIVGQASLKLALELAYSAHMSLSLENI